MTTIDELRPYEHGPFPAMQPVMRPGYYMDGRLIVASTDRFWIFDIALAESKPLPLFNQVGEYDFY